MSLPPHPNAFLQVHSNIAENGYKDNSYYKLLTTCLYNMTSRVCYLPLKCPGSISSCPHMDATTVICTREEAQYQKNAKGHHFERSYRPNDAKLSEFGNLLGLLAVCKVRKKFEMVVPKRGYAWARLSPL